ncbi:MAG: ABC transporter ATP-binding protein [Chthonomonas sp.]|nr:ABC transporter ATP-binding protein [Chthonomonas sp.]
MFTWLVNRLDPRIAREILSEKQSVIRGLLCSAAVAGLGGALALFIKLVVDAVSNKQPSQLVALSGLVIALFTIKYAFARAQAYYLNYASNRITTNLRVRLFEKLQRLPLSYFHEKRTGSLQSILSNDINVYSNAVTTLRDSIDGPIKIVSGLATAAVMQPKLAAVGLTVLPVLAFVIQRNARKMRTAQANVQDDLSNLSAMSFETLTGTRIIKAFGAEATVQERFGGLVEKSFESQMVAARRVATLKPMVELIGSVGIALVVLVCAWLLNRGELQVGDLAAFLFALDYMNQGFRNLGSLKQTTSQISAAADRIYAEVLNVPEPEPDTLGTRTFPEFQGRIEFRGVSFAYPDATEALKNVSFTIEPGRSLALVGPSGAGKSTIADLLLRFYEPTAGEILVDGVNVREISTPWLRSQVGVVPQQTFLFSGTIADNIRLGRPDATESEILDACKGAHADFVVGLPEGFSTKLGERGSGLSGGEAQRISIARAFVRKPKVLLLDEATSNLDALSEQAVQSALDELMLGRSTLFIAHRLTSAARANHIVMLRRGEIAEQGSFEELMRLDGSFAAMYRVFNQGFQEPELG